MAEGKKIFVGNYKGGVGKTTSIYQIALHLTEAKKKVLLIDLDPQCSLSEICLTRIDRHLEQLENNESLNFIYDMWEQFKQFPYLRYTINTTNLIKQTPEQIHFIPSNLFYTNGGLDQIASRLRDGFEDLVVLQQFFQSTEIESKYDYILFDCPPSNNVITQGAFLFSDYYLIPSIIQTMSIRGVVHYTKSVEKIYNHYCVDHKKAQLATLLFGPKPKLIGIFETLKKANVNNTQAIRSLKSELKEADIDSILSDFEEGNYFFKTVIQHYEAIARDTAEGKKRSEYAELTDEILFCLEPTLFNSLI
ncbi:ParA family protein [Bacillus sp. REN16]|uniref:ParA family protein n=1 Tax=Bacillus sp. REN16 TaxID=2887296 RepID=UPI001E53FB1D|nr:AAA family ATPase [Bacillus sp. REN16]MCC3358583.1 AAA family ATPase [Bacillus sp. REN16]